MNEDICFRVWDKVFNQYWTEEVIKENAGWLLFPNNININDIEIDRCTGSKDKKGKLIYEGDIVNHWFGDRYIKCVVRYDELSCGFGFFDKKGRMYPIHDDCEVIGNINEDPELLEN